MPDDRWAASVDQALLTAELPEPSDALPKILQSTGWWRDASTIPPRQFLLNQQYIRTYMTATIATGGRAKTTLTMTEAVSMIIGRDLLTGKEQPALLRVWYVNAEETQEELDRRLAAICQHYDITREMLGGRLHVHSVRKEPIRLMSADANGTAQVNHEAVVVPTEVPGIAQHRCIYTRPPDFVPYSDGRIPTRTWTS